MSVSNCFFVENMLSAHIDGELDLEGRSSVREHLKNCSRCRIKRELILSTINMTRDVRVPLSPAIIDRWQSEFRGKLVEGREAIHHLEYRLLRGKKRWMVIGFACITALLALVRIGIEFEKKGIKSKNVFQALAAKPPLENNTSLEPITIRMRVADLDQFRQDMKGFLESLPFVWIQEPRKGTIDGNDSLAIELEKEAYEKVIEHFNRTGRGFLGASDTVASDVYPTFILIVEKVIN